VNLDDLTTLYQANQTVVTSIAILAGVGVLLLIANRMHKMTGHRATLLIANILTIIAAALATMVSASGMWKFFTDILGETPLRYAFFGFIEVALLASALLARARLLRDPAKGSTGIDGAAVWIFAAMTASLSSLDADSFREVCLRLAAPLVAAWMWERALAAARSARLGRTATRINWTLSLERVLVWLKLAEAQGRDVTEVDRARRRARLGRARLNLYLLQSRKKTAAWRMRRAHNRVIRLAMGSAEHIGLADFPAATNEREAIQMYMATLYGFVDATTPEAVAHFNAWPMAAEVNAEHGGDHSPGRDDLAHGADAHQHSALPGALALTELPLHRLNGHSRDNTSDLDAISQRRQNDTITEGGQDLLDSPVPAWTASSPASDGEPSEDDDNTDDADEAADDDDADLSAVAAMRRFWEAETSAGRVPTGAELSRAAGVPPRTGLGRRQRRAWEPELPDDLRRPLTRAGDRP
jgi:hypothetical protein